MQLFLAFGICHLMRAVIALFWCLMKFTVLYCMPIRMLKRAVSLDNSGHRSQEWLTFLNAIQCRPDNAMLLDADRTFPVPVQYLLAVLSVFVSQETVVVVSMNVLHLSPPLFLSCPTTTTLRRRSSNTRWSIRRV